MCRLLWPEADKQVLKRGFHDKGGFPGVIGCVDGTHVRIQAPSTNVTKTILLIGKGFTLSMYKQWATIMVGNTKRK